MKTMSVAKLKAEFSNVVADLKRGHEVTITYGRQKLPLGTIIPQSKLKKPNYSVPLGDLKSNGWKYQTQDFEMTDEELLGS